MAILRDSSIVQYKAWMDQNHMLEWVDWVWDQYTKCSHHGGQDTYTLMDNLSVHLVQSVCSIMNKCGSGVELFPGG
jgi:hypothetical protein